MDITYGILHYNPSGDHDAEKAYIEAVKSLYHNRSSCFKSEIYLIDQASQPHLTHELSRTYDFNCLMLGDNVGISRGINLLANIARGEYVSLVTSDVTFTLGLDTTLVSALRADPKIYQICPTSDNSSLDHQRAPAAREDGILLENLCQELTIQFWPRFVFEKIGYFDERWKACYENLDFALRAFLEGGKVVIDQRAWCHHAHNMCVKSGARNHTYDGYINMPDGFNQEILTMMWNNKWPNIGKYINLYETFTKDMSQTRVAAFFEYSNNVYLPYVQEVGY